MVMAMKVSILSGTTIYSTDFSNFPIGDDQLVGYESWDSDANGIALHGIDNNLIPGGGKSGFLGLNPPDEDYISVWRPLDYAPLDQNKAVVRFSAVVAIIDSTNSNWDNFFISFHNQNGDALASINFDNTNSYIFLDDTEHVTNTEFLFVQDTFYQIELVIDFIKNEWSGFLDDEIVFDKIRFHGGDKALDLGNLSVDWLITNLEEPGDNWMSFDDINIIAEFGPYSVLKVPFINVSVNSALKQIQLIWDSEPNHRYEVERSTDLLQWDSGAPDSVFITGDEPEQLIYSDSIGSQSSGEFYRLKVNLNE